MAIRQERRSRSQSCLLEFIPTTAKAACSLCLWSSSKAPELRCHCGSGNGGRSLAPPTIVLQKCLSISGQSSRRGGCGSGGTSFRLQALGPVQGAVADVDMANRHCKQLCADAVAQAAKPDPRVARRADRGGAGLFHVSAIGGPRTDS